MKRFFRSGSFKTLVVIAVVVALGVLCACVSRSESSPFTTALGVIFTPLKSVSSAIASGFEEVSASFRSSTLYKAENAELEKQLMEYRKKLADYDEMKKKTQAYEKFYGIKEKNPDYEFAYASVISKDAADVYDSFVLNSVSTVGVSAGDPVIYGDYVVGIVKKVNFSTCVVYSVLDPRVNIGAYESGTKEYGYVSGDEKLYKEGVCKLSGLDNSTSVVSGGIVCTSGAGGVFPNGLIIGEITSVETDEITSSYYAQIKPFADPDKITDVFIITDFDGQGEIDVDG